MTDLQLPQGKRASIVLVAPHIWPVLADDRQILSAGGAEVQQSFIAHGLRDAGFPVSIITNVAEGRSEFELNGLRIIRIIRGTKEVPILRNIHPKLTSIWNALKHANASIVYQRCAGADTLVAGLFARLYDRRFIYSGAHDLDFKLDRSWEKFQGPGGWRELQLYRLGLKLAHGIVAQHHGQVADCQHWHQRVAVEIPNCYAAPKGSSSSRDGVVLWVATVKSWKRPELFLELARRLPHLAFRMIGGPGGGGEVRTYENIRSAARDVKNLEFIGFVPFSEVESHFDQARVFVNTSDYEGFPNTFLQSWARRIPTVSFIDCGAIEDGRSIGFVSKDLNEMAETVTRLMVDDALWEQEGRRAECYFEAKHSVKVAVEKYSNFFEQVQTNRGIR